MGSKVASLKAKAPKAEAASPVPSTPAPAAPVPPATRPAAPKGILDLKVPFVRITKGLTGLYEAKLANGMVVIIYTPEEARTVTAISAAINIEGLGL